MVQALLHLMQLELKIFTAFFVTQASAQALANNTSVTLSFGTTVFDTDSAMSSTTFTVPTGQAGKYYLYGAFRVNTSTNSTRLACDIKVNDSSIASWNTQNDDEDSSQCSAYADLSVGDAEYNLCFSNNRWFSKY